MRLTEDERAELEVAADRGAEFLDAVDPGWFWWVRASKIDMSDGGFFDSEHTCVLAQHNPKGRYRPGDYGLDGAVDTDIELGFTIVAGDNASWRHLTRRWKENVEDRQAARLR